MLALSTAISLVHAASAAAQATNGGGAAPSHAKEGSAAAPYEASEIVVTARRIEERLQDVPISVTVYNQQQIENKNITNTSDLALYTPSLGMSDPLGTVQATFSLRGFFQDAGTAATVGFFFDDVVAPRGASNQQAIGDGGGPGSFFDLQNVQVLKGPQGTLFGRNTTGGDILVVPQKPTNKFEGYVEGSYGNYNMERIQAVINMPLADTVRLRLGVDHETRDGFVKNNTDVGPSRFNNVNYTAARASLDVNLTSNIENYTVASLTHSQTRGEANTLIRAFPSPDLPAGALGPGTPAIPGAVLNPLGFLAQQELNQRAAEGAGFYSFENTFPDPRTQLDQWQVINTTTWRATDNLTVKNIISYAQLRYDLLNPVIGTAFDLSELNPYLPLLSALSGGIPTPPYPAHTILPFTNSNPVPIGGNTAFQNTYTEELQVQGNAFGNRLTYQAGVYYEGSRPLGRSGSLSPNLLYCPGLPNQGYLCASPFLNGGSAAYNDGFKSFQSVAIYGQTTYALTDQLKLTTGLRYTWDQQSEHGSLRTYNFTDLADFTSTTPIAPTSVFCTNPNYSLANGCSGSLRQKSSAPTWLIDLDYKPINDLLLYAKYARGYRTGGIALQLPTEIQLTKAEKVDTYEAGFKATFEGPIRGTFDFAGFFNDFRNQQVPVDVQPKIQGSVADAEGVVNAGKSQIWGFEVESTIIPITNVSVSVGYSYLNTRVLSIKLPTLSANSPYFIGGAPEPGDPLSNTPEHKLSVTGAYTLPIPRDDGNLTFAVTYTYTSKQLSTTQYRDANGKPSDLDYLAGRDIWDINVNWNHVAGSHVDLAAFVDNLTQDKYFTYLLPIASYFELAQLGTPRMFGMRLKYHFD
jgi:iron complex outermembrane receptor protein